LIVPRAGISNGTGISTMTSGLMFHPVGKVSAGGAVVGSPATAPVSAQAESVSISLAVSRRSLARWLYPGSANHGGIFFETTAVLIARAQGRDCS
jgi:hypothetical protein